MRKLATIRRVKEIKSIPEADQIELCLVDGWQCVCKKNAFKVNDLALYLEVDSFLPQRPEFEFLRKSSQRTDADGVVGFRLKTISLRKQLSQGLLMPLDELGVTGNEGDDLTEQLGIKVFEAPISGAVLAGDAKGNFPSFLQKTDQERIQNLTHMIDKFLSYEFEVTEKVDGSSCTIFNNNNEFGVCSRNLELREDENNSYWKIANQYNLREKLGSLNRNLAIQGELMGPGVNGNKCKLKQHDLYVFDIFDIDNHCYIDAVERWNLVTTLGLKSVPIIHYHFMMLEDSIGPVNVFEELLSMADGKSVLNPDVIREGLVFKRLGKERNSFKVISNKFLLKHGE